MSVVLTDALCTRCGLCCDGSLFADVEISRTEGRRLELLGLDVEDDERGRALLAQPCGALAGTRCTIYAQRPRCCRTFECRLLQDTRAGLVSVSDARERITTTLRAVRRAQRLIARLGGPEGSLPLAERAAETLGGDAGAAGSLRRQRRAELAAVLRGLERRIRNVFLASGGLTGPARRSPDRPAPADAASPRN